MHHDFIGALEDLVDSQVPKEPLDRVLLQVPIPAMHLESIVHHIEALVGSYLLGHSTVHGIVRRLIGQKSRRMPHHQARALELDCHLSELELEVLVIS